MFPSDEEVLEFLRDQDREQDYTELRPEPGAGYDSIDLAQLEPLIAARPALATWSRFVRSPENRSSRS